MLSLFPSLLFLTPLSPLLIRVAVGLSFLYLGYHHYQNRTAAASEHPFAGSIGPIILFAQIIVEFVIAASLIAGVFAQLGALIGFLVCVKLLILKPRGRSLVPFSTLALLLLAVMNLSVLITGAGLYAFDLPL